MPKTLRHRIKAIGGNHKRRQASLTPITGSASPGTPGVTGGAASPAGVPMTMPMSAVTVYPQPDGQYVTLGVTDLDPIFTADGAPIAATAPGRWDQLAAAGNPRDGARRRFSTTRRAQ